MWWAAILYHWDDDVDLLYHCNLFISLFSVSAFPSFKEKTYFKEQLSVVASKYSLCDTENNTQSKLCSMFKYSRNGNGMVYGPNETYPYNL